MEALFKPFRVLFRTMIWLANSPRKLLLAYSILIVVCGTLYDRFEPDTTFGDSIWWAVVTASTVGYGDISPETWQARLMAALLISVMVLLVIPLITAQFASKLIVDTDAFRHEEQEELKNNLRQVRALLEEMAARQGVAVPEALKGVAVSEAPQGVAVPEAPQGVAVPEAPEGVSVPDSAGPPAASSDR